MNIMYVQTIDARINSSANIRNVSLIKSLSEIGHNIYLVMDCSNKIIDEKLQDIIMNFSTISVKNYTKTYNNIENIKENTKQNKYKSKIIKILTKLIPYDITFLKNRTTYKNIIFPNKIDTIISSSDPNSSHLLAKKIKKRYPNANWIQYWGDIMSEDIQNGGSKKRNFIKAEYKFLRSADCIVYTNQIVTDYMKKIYKNLAHKINWIPTPFEIHKYEKPLNNFKVGYFGSFSLNNRDISNLCKVVVDLKKEIIVAGKGNIKLPEQVVKIDRCPFRELIKYENECNIVVVMENKYILLRDGTYGCLQVPGKLYHYSNSGFYILVICNGNILKKYYEKYDRFIFCNNNYEEIKKEIISICNHEKEKTIHTVRDFSSHEIAQAWTSIINKYMVKRNG